MEFEQKSPLHEPQIETSPMLSSSHKRVGRCSPAVFGTAPEAKRSMLDYMSGSELSALVSDEYDGRTATNAFAGHPISFSDRASYNENDDCADDEQEEADSQDENEKSFDESSLYNRSNTAFRQMIFPCDMTADFTDKNGAKEDELTGQILPAFKPDQKSAEVLSTRMNLYGNVTLTARRSTLAEVAKEAGFLPFVNDGRVDDAATQTVPYLKNKHQAVADQKDGKKSEDVENSEPVRDVANDNIANSSAYIGSLLNIVGGDSSFNDSFMSSDADTGAVIDKIIGEWNNRGNKEPAVEDEQQKKEEKESEEKDNEIFAKKCVYDADTHRDAEEENDDDAQVPQHVEDEDDFLLSNLPTSVDDFQAKEFHLKLGRNLSSPHALQSPAATTDCGHPMVAGLETPTKIGTIPSFKFGTGLLNACEASTSRAAHLACPALSGSAAKQYFPGNAGTGQYGQHSRTMSNASDDEGDVDPNDLEVAMINESFEEQQKQSLMYAGKGLRSLFYSTQSSTGNDLEFGDIVVDPNEPSTSYVPNSHDDSSEVDIDKLDAMVAASLCDDDSTLDDNQGDASNIHDDSTADDEDTTEHGSTSSDGHNTINIRANQFIPLLTPKSRQLVMQQRKSFARTGKYHIPTMTLPEANPIDDKTGVFPNGYPLLDPHLFERDSDEAARLLADKHTAHLETESESGGGFRPEIDVLASPFNGVNSDTAKYDGNNNNNNGASHKIPQGFYAAFLGTDKYGSTKPEFAMPPIAPFRRADLSDFRDSVGDANDVVTVKDDTDEMSEDHANAKMVAYGVVRSILDSPIFMDADYDEDKVFMSTPKCNNVRLPRFNIEEIRRCNALGTDSAGSDVQGGEDNDADVNEAAGGDSDGNAMASNNGGGDDLAGVTEEDGSIELSASDMVDGATEFTHSSSRARLLFDDADDFDEAEKFKCLNLNNTNNKNDDTLSATGQINKTSSSSNNNPNDNNADHMSKDAEVSDMLSPSTAAVMAASSTSSSMSSFSFLDKSSKAESLCDEQAVPVLDSWEHLDDNEDLIARMVNEAKAKVAVPKESEAIVLSDPSQSNTSEEENSLAELAHVIEASCPGAVVRAEEDVADAIRYLSGSAADVWYRKVDGKRYMVVFPNADQASDALFTKQAVTFLQLKALTDASDATRRAAVTQKSQLLPKRRRPATTVTVARRLIANSLNMRIDVSASQREKETRQLAEAKESKRQKKAIWEGN